MFVCVCDRICKFVYVFRPINSNKSKKFHACLDNKTNCYDLWAKEKNFFLLTILLLKLTLKKMIFFCVWEKILKSTNTFSCWINSDTKLIALGRKLMKVYETNLFWRFLILPADRKEKYYAALLCCCIVWCVMIYFSRSCPWTSPPCFSYKYLC